MTHEERKEWLDSLTEGSSVAIDLGRCTKNWVITKITKITPKRKFRVAYHDDLYMEGGCTRLDSWTSYQIEPVTPEITAMVERQRNIDKIRQIKVKTLSDAKLKAIVEIAYELG